MTDTTAKIRAKGLDSTGVTEELARRMHANIGGHYLAIIDLRVARQLNDDDGGHGVELVIDQIEPVVDGKLDGAIVDHVRDIQAALYRNRKLLDEGEQLPLDDDGGPTPAVKDILAQGLGLFDDEPDDDEDGPDPDDPTFEPHPFADGPDALCVACRQPAGANVHHTDREPAREPVEA